MIAPQNSIYVKTLHQMGEGWKSRTNGRVTYTILAGGDESEEGLLRNIRPNFRNLHAAQLSAITLANLDDAFNVFGLLMFFESYAEADRVLEKLSPGLEQRLEAKGYKALNWAYVGWITSSARLPSPQSTPSRKRETRDPASVEQPGSASAPRSG